MNKHEETINRILSKRGLKEANTQENIQENTQENKHTNEELEAWLKSNYSKIKRDFINIKESEVNKIEKRIKSAKSVSMGTSSYKFVMYEGEIHKLVSSSTKTGFAVFELESVLTGKPASTAWSFDLHKIPKYTPLGMMSAEYVEDASGEIEFIIPTIEYIQREASIRHFIIRFTRRSELSLDILKQKYNRFVQGLQDGKILRESQQVELEEATVSSDIASTDGVVNNTFDDKGTYRKPLDRKNKVADRRTLPVDPLEAQEAQEAEESSQSTNLIKKARARNLAESIISKYFPED